MAKQLRLARVWRCRCEYASARCPRAAARGARPRLSRALGRKIAKACKSSKRFSVGAGACGTCPDSHSARSRSEAVAACDSQDGQGRIGRLRSCARRLSVTYPRRILANPPRQAMTQETRSFQAEVSRLLEIVAHSLYSEKEIFLRELISNASDACDRLRYAALTEPRLAEGDTSYRVVLTPDKSARALIVADNGIGMNREELIENLGTIARSGTAAFVGQLTGDARKDMSLIGQFGVGFYSAFMVADKVEVLSRKAGENEGWRWTSEGKGEFTIEEAPETARGAKIIVHLREGEDEYLEPFRIRRIVKTYSDHIALPIVLTDAGKEETINTASALWTRTRSEITPEQYKEFYHHVGHSFDDPWLTLHNKAEGVLEYTSLLFVPSSKPFDLSIRSARAGSSFMF